MADSYNVLLRSSEGCPVQMANQGTGTITYHEDIAVDYTTGLPTTGPNAIGSLDVLSLIAIWNSRDSGKIVRVKRLGFDDSGASLGGTAPQMYQLFRTTAQDGGERLTPRKLDSTAGAVPSQVAIAAMPSATTTGNALRQIFSRTSFAQNVITAPARFGQLGAVRGALSNALLLTGADDNVQRQILREGEGMAVVLSDVMSSDRPVLVGVWFSIAGVSYYVEGVVIVIAASTPSFGIFNGSGSGVLVSVDRIAVTDVAYNIGNYNPAIGPTFSLETISAMRGGIDLPVSKFDSSSPALPDAIKVQKRAGVFQVRSESLASNASGVYRDGPIRRPINNWFGTSPAFAAGIVGALGDGFERGAGFTCKSEQGELVLREGQGAAVIYRALGNNILNQDPFGSWNIDLLFTVENASAPTPAAGVSRSRIFARS